jgi:hypothetical protein
VNPDKLKTKLVEKSRNQYFTDRFLWIPLQEDPPIVAVIRRNKYKPYDTIEEGV